MSRIPFHCPHCQVLGETATKFAGKLVNCPKCGKPFKLEVTAPPPIETAEEKAKNEKPAEESERLVQEEIEASNAEAARLEWQNRSEAEILMSIEEKLGKANEFSKKQDKQLSEIKHDVGCLFQFLVVLPVFGFLLWVIALFLASTRF